MSDGFQRNLGRRKDGATLQERLDAALRELETTKTMLRLTELRLNTALGMPSEQVARMVRDFDSPAPLATRPCDAPIQFQQPIKVAS
jgi:hypothetical protein